MPEPYKIIDGKKVYMKRKYLGKRRMGVPYRYQGADPEDIQYNISERKKKDEGRRKQVKERLGQK